MSSQSQAPVAENQQPAPLPPSNMYVVVAGDTIYVVARKFGITVRTLIDANGLQAPFQLEPGQVLHLPSGGDYVVVKGDTLAKIARRAGVEFGTLARMNNLSPPYVIHIGQRLILPTGTKAPPPEMVTAEGDTTVIQSPNAGQPPVTAAPVQTMTVETLPAPAQPSRDTTTFGSATRPGLVPDVPAARVQGGAPASAPAATPVLTPAPSADSKPLPARTQAPADNGSGAAPAPSAQQQPAQALVQSATPVPAEPSRLQTAAAAPAHAPAPVGPPVPAFIWPVHGPVLSTFGTIAKGQRNDGINIAVPKGTPVLAAADGEVAYAGNELRGFGYLLLVTHKGTDYVTAYAHNDKILVRRGEHVHKGQTIALSGDSGGVSPPQVHFELRQGVKAIDPQTVLPPELSPAASPAAQPGPG